jgi:hypothetical protein
MKKVGLGEMGMIEGFFCAEEARKSASRLREAGSEVSVV